MREIFVDTSYHVALVDSDDRLHDVASSIGHALLAEGSTLVTTDSVLVEFLTFLSAGGSHVRRAARRYIDTVYAQPSFVVIPQSPSLFSAALDLYSKRPDKTYSMVDCISMVVCSDRGITDVLTYDHDFEQEGFRALLRRPGSG